MNTNDSTDDGAPGEGERIAKVLSRAGVASRRDAERLVLEGRVRLNGEVVTSPATNVTPRDRLAVDGETVGAPEATRLWIFHKPAGLVTTEHDEEGRPTVFESLPEDMPRVMSVGRLDLTSEGLLLLTNDGEIKRRLELPSTGWLRRYRVRINGSLSEEQLDELRRGITVDGIEYQPMEVSFDRQQGANAWLTIGLREGKNREVRRVIEHMGATVNRLIRVSYGPFQLGDLPVGEVEEVRAKVVRDQLGLAKPAPVRTRKRPAPDAAPAAETEDRPERDRLATARPAGATVKREIKGRAPKARSERTEEAPRPPRPARKAAGPDAFAKPRTWMRADEARAAREEAPEGERPQRSRAVPGESKPRSSGFKSHGRPARSEGGETRPRAAGFRSHKAEGERPARPEGDRGPRRFGSDDRPPRRRDEEGDRPRAPREGGSRPYKPRAGAEGDERPARAYKPREGGDRPYKPRPPRDGEDRPARPYKPRVAREDGDRPARSYAPRPPRDGDDRPARPYRPREAGDRPYKARPPREGGDRPPRSFSPSRPARDGDDRPARPYKPRPPREGDEGRPARPPRRTEGDRPARPYKPREGDREGRPARPPREAGERPPRGERPEGGRPPRATGPGGPRKGPPRAGGAGGRPSGSKPRKG